jgi:Carboxypeptidase regulatory-like domain
MNWKRFFVVAFALLVAMSIGSTRLAAQTSSSGDVAGVVTDQSGALVPDAKVVLKDLAKGNTQDTTTSKDGAYRFYLLTPGTYTVSVSATGFNTETRQVDVTLGQITSLNFQMSVGSSTTTVTVTESAPLLQTENGNMATTLNNLQIQNVPNPGNDLSYIAQTAPGVVMNTQAGYGNFSANGLPGNSNLFTINGMDDNDPFLNLNNSGSTNLLLGQNEVQEATVVSNGYSGQFGTLAGANINYITKSGGNDYHGRAIYYWNGSAMNAESYLSHAAGNPKPFSNANQWGGDIGGPLKKDKLFWYFNTEGLRVILPSSQNVNIPTTAFESQVVKNLTSTGLSASIPFYCQNIAGVCPGVGPVPVHIPGQPVNQTGAGIFNLLNTAPGAANAKDVLPPGKYVDANGNAFATGDGCSNFPGLGVGATAAPCALQFRSNAPNFSYEYLLSTRFDYNWGAKDRIFIRVQSDRGDQATFTDPVNPVFDAHSFQPEYQGQLVETHTLGATAVNQFILSTAWYSAIFQSKNLPASLAAFPSDLLMNDGSLGNPATGFAAGGENEAFPQGRNVTQFQVSDDFSKTVGNHALKFGTKFRDYKVSDHGFSNRLNGLLIPFSLDDFAWGGNGNDGVVPGTAGGPDTSGLGGVTQLQQRFPTALSNAFHNYTIAVYAEDGIRIRPNLTVTAALRVEHQSDPTCYQKCFANTQPWFNLALDPTGIVPYNETIAVNQKKLVPNLTAVQWEPRVSFAWQPFGTQRNTVIRGGVGIFFDGFQGSLNDSFSTNPPLSNRFNITNTNGAPLSPTETSTPNLFAETAAVNTAFVAGFPAGLNETQIAASLPPGVSFAAPSLASSDSQTKVPQYYKWSLEWQQGIGRNDVVSIQYAGNHGINELIQNAGVNGFFNPANLGLTSPASFGDLPTSKPDARFRTVTLFQSSGVSNYNGLVLTYKHQFTSGIVNFNYSYSKAMDESEGLDPFNLNTNTSIRFQEDPQNLRRNYGPADWSVKHYISANYVWTVPVRKALMGHGWAALVDGWQVAGTVFFRTGLPFTVLDSAALPLQSSAFSYGSQVFGTYNGTTVGQAYMNCGGGIATTSNRCLNPALFTPAGTETGFGNLGRNAFVGPHFFDTDFSVMKMTKIPHWERGQLGIGAQFFNLFNHPNFDQPFQDLASGAFGTTFLQVASPTSILGSFLGGDNSPRLIQIKAQIVF